MCKIIRYIFSYCLFITVLNTGYLMLDNRPTHFPLLY